MLDALTAQSQRWKPLTPQIQPEGWVAKGASPTYVTQWKTAQNELNYFLGSVAALAKKPERMPLALDAYFRMQALDSTLGSVIEGIRKYQSPSLADQVQAALNENSVNRDRLRQYVQDLAVQKEQEFQVADREAQRCRGMLLRQPSAPKGTRK
jgi:hypothetical protein